MFQAKNFRFNSIILTTTRSLLNPVILQIIYLNKRKFNKLIFLLNLYLSREHYSYNYAKSIEIFKIHVL